MNPVCIAVLLSVTENVVKEKRIHTHTHEYVRMRTEG